MVDKEMKVNGYNITPFADKKILNDIDFNVVNIGEDKVYISKKPYVVENEHFWCTFYLSDVNVNRVELHFSDKALSLNYSSGNNVDVDVVINKYNNFLENIFGTPDAERINGVQYAYDWGEIISYYDNKSMECGILIKYRR